MVLAHATFVHFFAVVIKKNKKEHCNIITVFLQRILSWDKSTPKHSFQWERNIDTLNPESRHLNQSNAVQEVNIGLVQKPAGILNICAWEGPFPDVIKRANMETHEY